VIVSSGNFGRAGPCRQLQAAPQLWWWAAQRDHLCPRKCPQFEASDIANKRQNIEQMSFKDKEVRMECIDIF